MTSPSRKNREKFHRTREKLQLSARLGLEYNYVLLNVAINIPLYKIFIDSKGIFFFYYYNYLPRVYFLLIQLHVTDANYS